MKTGLRREIGKWRHLPCSAAGTPCTASSVVGRARAESATSCNRRWLVSWEKNSAEIRVWDTMTGASRLVMCPGLAVQASVSDDGTLAVLYYHDCTVKVVAIHRNGAMQDVSDERIATCVAISPNSRMLAAGFYASRINIVQLRTGWGFPLCFGQNGLFPSPHNVAFSSDGELVVAGCTDGVARLWNLGDGKLIWQSRQLKREPVRANFAERDVVCVYRDRPELNPEITFYGYTTGVESCLR